MEGKKVWGKNAKTGKKSKTLNKGEVIRHKNKYYNILNTEKAKKN